MIEDVFRESYMYYTIIGLWNVVQVVSIRSEGILISKVHLPFDPSQHIKHHF